MKLISVQSSKLLQLSGYDVLRMLDLFSSKETDSRDGAVNITPNKFVRVGKGEVREDSFPVQITIGTHGLYTNEIVSDFTVLEAIKNLYHELGHADHVLSKFESCERFSSEMKIDYIACDGNAEYYGLRKGTIPAIDYWHNIREADVEAKALGKLHDLLKDKQIFPDISDADADDIMLNYMGTQMFVYSSTGYFGKPNAYYYFQSDIPLDNIDDMYGLFQKTLAQNAKYNRQNYSVLTDRKSEFRKLATSNETWMGIYNQFAAEQDGFRRTCMAASMTMCANPKRDYKKEFALTEEEESMLDFQKLFGVEQPPVPWLTKQSLNIKRAVYRAVKPRLDREPVRSFLDGVEDEKDSQDDDFDL